MASSGSFLTKGWYSSSKGDYVYLEFAWQVSSSSVANNSTTIKWELHGKRTASGFVNAGGFKVVIDGTTVYSKSTDYRIELRNGTVVASGTHTPKHDSAGKKTFSASAEGGIYTYAVNSTGSGSWALPTVPRQATLVSAPNFTDEEKPTITYSNPAGTSATTLQACISLDGSTANIAYRNISKSGTSYTFSLTDAERNVLRNATTTSNSKTVYFIVKTIIGGVTYTSKLSKTLTIVNAKPTFTADQLTYADMDSNVVAITGNNQTMVQNQSYFAVGTGKATGNKGASIVQYNIELNGVTREVDRSGTYTMGVINSSKDVDLIVTAVDSRGNTTTAKKTIPIIAWSAPTFTVALERLNNYEDETYLTVDASIASIDSKNVMTITYKVKEDGGSYGIDNPINNKEKYTLNFDKNKAYVLSVTVADLFDSTTKEFPLAKGKFPLFIDTEKNAVGVNEFPKSGEALRVAGGDAVFEGKVNNLAMGSLAFNTNTTQTIKMTEPYRGVAIVCLTANAVGFGMWAVSFRDKSTLVSADRIIGALNNVSFEITEEGTITVTCPTNWSYGWYILNG